MSQIKNNYGAVAVKPIDVKKAARIIRRGGLVIFPTETVYGLGASVFNEKAIQRVFKVKGRPKNKPLIAHIAKMGDLDKFAKQIPKQARQLAKKFWPGPLTLVLRARKRLPNLVAGKMNIRQETHRTVALRMPDHPLTLELIRIAGPIVGPSANFYNQKPPRSVKEILPKLLKQVDAALDGGRTKLGIPSTIVDFTQKPPKILREGVIKI